MAEYGWFEFILTLVLVDLFFGMLVVAIFAAKVVRELGAELFRSKKLKGWLKDVS